MNSILSCMNSILSCMNSILSCMNSILSCMNSILSCMNSILRGFCLVKNVALLIVVVCDSVQCKNIIDHIKYMYTLFHFIFKHPFIGSFQFPALCVCFFSRDYITDRLLTSGTPVFSTNKPGRHDITWILLKVKYTNQLMFKFRPYSLFPLIVYVVKNTTKVWIGEIYQKQNDLRNNNNKDELLSLIWNKEYGLNLNINWLVYLIMLFCFVFIF
jgi:hypothetical protein